MVSKARTEAACIRGAFADLIPVRAPTLQDLALNLIRASEALRTSHDADWNRLNDAHFGAQHDFRQALEEATGMPLDVLEKAMEGL